MNVKQIWAYLGRYKWFVSEKKDSFLSIKDNPERIDIPHHQSEIKDVPFFWNLDHINKESVACVGCSITYGQGLLHQEKWPSLLSDQLGMPTLNFGLTGGGCDIIYINLKNAIEFYNFNTVIINLPDLARKIARKKIDNRWFRWPVVEYAGWKDLPPHLLSIHKEIERAIEKDKFHRYSKRIIKKIIRLCETAGKNYFITSWDDTTYGFLQSLDIGTRLLPEYKLEGPRIQDGFHPTLFQNKKFVSDIKTII